MKFCDNECTHAQEVFGKLVRSGEALGHRFEAFGLYVVVAIRLQMEFTEFQEAIAALAVYKHPDPYLVSCSDATNRAHTSTPFIRFGKTILVLSYSI